MSEYVLIQVVSSIGVQWLSGNGTGRFYMNLRNRTYSSRVEVPVSSVERWIEALSKLYPWT